MEQEQSFNFLHPAGRAGANSSGGSEGGAVPQEVVLVGETLQQQTEHVADGGDGGLGERGVPQGQQQPGDQLELPQQFGVFRRLAVSHASENTHGSRACRKGNAASESFLFLFFVIWHLPGFRQQLNEMLEQRQMELVRSVEPHLRSGGNTLRPLSRKVSLSNTNFGQEQASHRTSSGRTFNSHISVAAADNIFQKRTKEIFLQMFHQARKY